ncbi:uncharacterized protein LOC132270115 [Cornus florida]|uniref:uncharacterized protein LOC132270115 n=1 Tax=Cornus florida TaxID=4283 RepID=UPI0028975254|nr:uncharacterized protein LOC132270115 [Cornus florida]
MEPGNDNLTHQQKAPRQQLNGTLEDINDAASQSRTLGNSNIGGPLVTKAHSLDDVDSGRKEVWTPAADQSSSGNDFITRLGKEMDERINGLKAQIPEDMAREFTASTVKTSFTDKIERVARPKKFTMPKFIKLNGIGDPLQHLNHYTQEMTLEAHNDLFMCKIFPSSLTGVALEWFKNRPCKSIPNFESLCVMFLAQYCGNKKQKKTFLTRFNMESSSIPDCNQDTAIEALKIAMVQSSRFHSSLVKKTPTNMSELNSWALNYIRLEENEVTR